MKRILVTGASGFLGSHICAWLCNAGHRVIGACGSHPDRMDIICNHLNINKLHLDLTLKDSIISAFRSADPDAVVHAAAMADLGACEKDKPLARKVNIDATYEIAKLCQNTPARLIFLSTDQVFDGNHAPYSEKDLPAPIHEYGRTKAEAERKALDVAGEVTTVVRVALVYGTSPTGLRSSSEQVVNALRDGRIPRLFLDEIRNPVSADDVASAVTELVSYTKPLSHLHLGGPDPASRYDIGIAAAKAFGLDPDAIEAVRHADLTLATPRPKDLSLDTSLAGKILAAPPRSLLKGLEHEARRS